MSKCNEQPETYASHWLQAFGHQMVATAARGVLKRFWVLQYHRVPFSNVGDVLSGCILICIAGFFVRKGLERGGQVMPCAILLIGEAAQAMFWHLCFNKTMWVAFAVVDCRGAWVLAVSCNHTVAVGGFLQVHVGNSSVFAITL